MLTIWGVVVKTGVSLRRKVGLTHFFSYFKRTFGQTNNYIGSWAWLLGAGAFSGPNNPGPSALLVEVVKVWGWRGIGIEGWGVYSGIFSSTLLGGVEGSEGGGTMGGSDGA